MEGNTDENNGNFVGYSIYTVVGRPSSSCSREEKETGTEIVKKTSTETAPDPVIMDQDIVQDMEEERVADFTVTLGTHEDGEALLDSLTKNHFRVSKWSMQALAHRNFPVEAKEQQVDVIVMSLLEMGFLQDELVSLDAAIKRAKKLGFEVCTPELAAQLRLQYTDQPDWSTGDRLGQFFVATEAIDLYADGVPKSSVSSGRCVPTQRNRYRLVADIQQCRGCRRSRPPRPTIQPSRSKWGRPWRTLRFHYPSDE